MEWCVGVSTSVMALVRWVLAIRRRSLRGPGRGLAHLALRLRLRFQLYAIRLSTKSTSLRLWPRYRTRR